jgi:hypothetical protein
MNNLINKYIHKCKNMPLKKIRITMLGLGETKRTFDVECTLEVPV